MSSTEYRQLQQTAEWLGCGFDSELSLDVDAAHSAIERVRELPRSVWQRLALWALRRALRRLEGAIQ